MYVVDDEVEKIGGQYGGPGVIKAVISLNDGNIRYIVSHKIEGGWGQLLHIYSPQQIKPRERKS
jgi:hypothetical protein